MKGNVRNVFLFAAWGMILLSPHIAAADPVDAGDAAVGLSVSDVDNTIELVSAGGVLEADSWNKK
jgi:hypothetical protein